MKPFLGQATLQAGKGQTLVSGVSSSVVRQSSARLISVATPQQQRLHLQLQKQNGTAQRAAVIAHAAPVSKSSSSSSSSGDLAAGLLFVFEKNERCVLALVVRPDGKKNWMVLDEAGRMQSIQPKQAIYTLPGGPYNEADMGRFSKAAAAADASLLELTWELTGEESAGSALSVESMSSLLFDSTTPTNLYTTLKLLRGDTLYYKQVGRASPVAFEARTPAAVEEIRRKADADACVRSENEGWSKAVATALGAKARSAVPSSADWLAGPYKERVVSLMSLALNPDSLVQDTRGTSSSTSSSALAKSSCALAQVKPEPVAVSCLLIDMGVWRQHEPLQSLASLSNAAPPSSSTSSSTSNASSSDSSTSHHASPSPSPDLDASHRRDLRHLTVFTIDDSSTSEVDDGLSTEVLPDGRIRIWIHIADPTRWLQPNDVLDLEARARTRTLYFPFGSRTMFPEALAKGPFSLRQGMDSNAMSIGVVLDSTGAVSLDEGITCVASTIQVTHRLDYDGTDDLLAMEEHCPMQQLLQLAAAATARRGYRFGRGAIDIPLPESDISVPRGDLDASRPRVSMRSISQWTSASRGMVAEMMILAGEAVGRVGVAAGLALPYRGQDQPRLPSAAAMAALPSEMCRAYAARRCMTRSSMGSTPTPHASLGLDAYVQVTSPIRRYGDILAHFQLKAWMRGETPPFRPTDIDSICSIAADKSRELSGAEREVEHYWVAEFLRQRQDTQWTATLLGWFKPESRLAVILLEELGLESITKVSDMEAVVGDTLSLTLSEVDPWGGVFRFSVSGVASHAAPADEAEPGEGEESEGFIDDLLDKWADEESEVGAGGEEMGQAEVLKGEGVDGAGQVTGGLEVVVGRR
ncbi:MAG: hypothetical protein WDW38_000552 [Sanguina aurantia]